MGVFLRWGVFGILAVAALLYAYNASKRLSESRESARVAAPQAGVPDDALADAEITASPDDGEVSALEPEPEPELEMPAACERERLVAERALKMRRDGEPLDRLLRIDVIIFESDEQRRARLEAVARQWFEREGRDPDSRTLRREVLRDCQRVSPAP